MSRGYPDFFSQPTFPSFGPTYDAGPISIVLAAGLDTNAISLTGKLIVRSGWFYLSGVDDPSVYAIQTYHDGNLIEALSLENMITYGQFKSTGPGWYLTKYAPGEMVYIINCLGEYTVGLSYTLRMVNNCAGAVTIKGNLFYSQVIGD